MFSLIRNLGSGIFIANGVDAVVKLAEQLQAPVCNSYLHNDSFPNSHELCMGPLGYQVYSFYKDNFNGWLDIKCKNIFVQLS